jgi:hypothetical protein
MNSRYDKNKSETSKRDRERDAMVQRITSLESTVRSLVSQMAESNRLTTLLLEREKRNNGR